MGISAIAMAEAGVRECRLVHEFLNQRVRSRVATALGDHPSIEQQTFHGLFLRTLAWMRTIWKMNEPAADFQAISAASRSLFEIAVDVVLLHFDAKAASPEQLVAWEDSAKLKSVVKIQEFFSGKKAALSLGYEPQMQFMRTNTKRVEALRTKYWPRKSGKAQHPSRWTGHDLGQDASKATRLFPSGEFDEYYAVRYPVICWNTHGSGLTAIRTVEKDSFPALSALALRECVRFGLVAAELILRHLGQWDSVVESEFEEHHKSRILSYAWLLT